MDNVFAVIKLILLSLVPVVISALLGGLENKSPFNNLNKWTKQLIIGVIFGLSAMLATQFGVEYKGAVLNVRDASPICAGLFFGGPAGIIAGVIGGVYRALVTFWGLGEYTALACSAATVLSGIVAALLRKFALNNKRPKWYYAFAIGLLCEVTHMLLIVLTNTEDLHEAFTYVQICTFPMVLFCGLSVMLSALSLFFLDRNHTPNSKGPKSISYAFQKFLALVTVSGFCVSTVFTFMVQTKLSVHDTENILRLNISDVANDIYDVATQDMLKIAFSITDELDNEAQITSEKLLDYSELFNVAQLNYVDENGIVRASTSPQYIGYDMRDGEQSAEFMVLLEGEKRAYVQKYQPISIDNNVSMRYVGVSLLKGGFIQMGYDKDQHQAEISLLVSEATQNRHLNETGYIIITDSKGKIISSPKGDVGESIDLIGIDNNSVVLDELFESTLYGETCYCVCLETEGFRAFGIMPKSEALFSRSVSMYLNMFMEALVFAAAFILVYILVDRLMVRNIKKVNESLGEITDGNLDVTVDVSSSYEFLLLSEDINKTVLTLKRYISEAETRIDKELEFARSIQQSALPHVFPPFPQRSEFDIYASMNAAKEVGGDFYDFYFVGNNKLCFLIADVSGKGIPAAMFMMSAKTLIKGYAEAGKGAAETLSLVNEGLCENNDANMFITAWLGILDLQTGVLKFANAGHNPPLLKRADTSFEYLNLDHGFVLAVMEGIEYKENAIKLEKGDKLYLYTDGVTEAADNSGELYAEERLKAALKEVGDLSPKEICDRVKNSVGCFAGDAPQTDDITMLCLSYYGSKGEAMKVKVDIKELTGLTEFVEGYFTDNQLPFSEVIKMNIALDEIYSNICKFSGATYAKVTCFVKEGLAVLEFEDDGKPFDPTKVADADTSLSLEDRPIGGMGILMVKKSMDRIKYSYENNRNILTLYKSF